MTDYLKLASQRGIKLDFDQDLSGLPLNSRNLTGLKARLRRFQSMQKPDGRIYPQYSRGRLSIIVEQPNIGALPAACLKGDFRVLGIPGVEAILFLRECGETAAANWMVDHKASVGTFVHDYLKFDRSYVTDAKVMLFRCMYGTEPESDSEKSCLPVFHSKLPGIKDRTFSKTGRDVAGALPLLVAPDVEQMGGKVVGFYHGDLLVECPQTYTEQIKQCFYDRLNQGGVSPSAPQALDPLADALAWLKECGGTMAMSNNPLSQRLIKAGLARRGGYNKLGQRTLVLED